RVRGGGPGGGADEDGGAVALSHRQLGEVAGEALDRPGHRRAADGAADAAVVEHQVAEALLEVRRLEALPVAPARAAAADPHQLRRALRPVLLEPDVGLGALE